MGATYQSMRVCVCVCDCMCARVWVCFVALWAKAHFHWWRFYRTLIIRDTSHPPTWPSHLTSGRHPQPSAKHVASHMMSFPKTHDVIASGCRVAPSGGRRPLTDRAILPDNDGAILSPSARRTAASGNGAERWRHLLMAPFIMPVVCDVVIIADWQEALCTEKRIDLDRCASLPVPTLGLRRPSRFCHLSPVMHLVFSTAPALRTSRTPTRHVTVFVVLSIRYLHPVGVFSLSLRNR